MKAKMMGELWGIKLGRSSPIVSHLLLANDLMIFAKAMVRDAKAIQLCLNKYSEWYGQKVNCEKILHTF